MPTKKKRRVKKSVEEHTHLALRIDAYKVRAKAGINHYAHTPQYAWRDTQDEPLYEFETDLEIAAVCTYPEGRAGDAHELLIYGDASPESDIYWSLKDTQLVDKHHVPTYRPYRGKQIPVYDPPKGMGTLQQERGEPRWHGTIWAQPRYVSDLLVLLGHNHELYLSIHERKLERRRWIQSITVQTTDPAKESPNRQDLIT
jgi:hypothetical protein